MVLQCICYVQCAKSYNLQIVRTMCEIRTLYGFSVQSAKYALCTLNPYNVRISHFVRTICRLYDDSIHCAYFVQIFIIPIPIRKSRIIW